MHIRSAEKLLYQMGKHINAGLDTSTARLGTSLGSILFSDVVGFTEMSTRLTPMEVVHVLYSLFMEYDKLCNKYDRVCKVWKDKREGGREEGGRDSRKEISAELRPELCRYQSGESWRKDRRRFYKNHSRLLLVPVLVWPANNIYSCSISQYIKMLEVNWIPPPKKVAVIINTTNLWVLRLENIISWVLYL